MKIKYKRFLFFIAYFLINFKFMSETISELKTISFFAELLSFIILIGLFFMQDNVYKTKSFIKLLFILILLIISSYKINNKIMLKFFLLILVFKDIEFSDFIKKDFYIKLIGVSCMYLLCKLGIIPDSIIYKESRLIHTYGFPHWNTLGTYITMMMIDLFYLLFNKKNKIFYISMGISIYLLYTKVYMRTGIVLLCLLPILSLTCVKWNILHSKIIKLLIPNCFVILTLVSILVTFLYMSDNKMANEIDRIVNKRFYYSSLAFKEYNVTLFGNNIKEDKNFLIDNAYIKLLINFGLLTLVAFEYMFRTTINNLLKNNDNKLLVIMVLLMIMGLSEASMYLINFNPFLLLFANIFNNNEEGIQNED